MHPPNFLANIHQQNQKAPGKKKSASFFWRLLIFLIIVLLLAGLLFAAYFGYQKTYAGKFYRGVTLGGVDIGGLTPAAAKTILQEKIDRLTSEGFAFSYKTRQISIITHVVSPTDPDIAYELLNFDLEQSLNQAFNFGRDKTSWENVRDRLAALIAGKNIKVAYQLQQDKFLENLKANFMDLETPGQNAKLVFSAAFTPGVEKEKIGWTFNYETAIQQLKSNLDSLDNPPIELILQYDIPTIQQSNPAVMTLVQEIAPLVLGRGPLTLTADGQEWVLSQEQLAGWLIMRVSADQRLTLGIDPEAFNKFLAENLAPQVNQELQDAKLTITDGRVSEFQAARAGRVINPEATLQSVNSEFVEGSSSKVSVSFKVTQPKILTEDINQLGLKELIGVGVSSFTHSTKNRIHNITTGAKALNGLLIKPGEEFSLVEALGIIGAQSGYVPELVLKGNKIIPEYGGGLCQIGTTIFRAALASGLPITERQAHSLRLSYYEPAGFDAAIYGPHPDVRFINDTGNNILIQSKIEGETIKFEFWGTKDGRSMLFTGQETVADLQKLKPEIGEYVYPPATKYVESVDLPVGEKQCSGTPISGATTDFSYQVTYPNGEVKNQDFHSVYKPWQMVCLIGVDKLSAPEVVSVDNTTILP